MQNDGDAKVVGLVTNKDSAPLRNVIIEGIMLDEEDGGLITQFRHAELLRLRMDCWMTRFEVQVYGE